MIALARTILLLTFCARGSAAAPDGPIALGSGPHLFVDDCLIASHSELTRAIGRPERLPEPVITGREDHSFQP